MSFVLNDLLPAESSPRWYALVVKPQHEKAAASALRNKDLEEFLPLQRSVRRWSDRIKELDLPLFPGYVFCRFGSQERLEVLRTPSVAAIVRFGNVAAPVPDPEIASLKILVNSRLPLTPWPWLRIDQRVRIEEGPLAGVEGTLLRIKDCCRVIVSVSLLQRSVSVEVDGASLSPVDRHDTADRAYILRSHARQGQISAETRAYYRSHRAGRILSGRVPAGQGL